MLRPPAPGRFRRALAVLIAAALAPSAAFAQYGGGPGPSPSPTPTGAAASEQGRLSVNDPDVTPGQTITASGNAAFRPGAQVSLFWLRLRPGANPVGAGTTTAGSDGSFSLNVTAPAEVGVYVLYAQGEGPSGGTKVLIAVITVRLSGTNARYQAVGVITREDPPQASEAQAGAEGGAPAVPPEVRAIYDRMQEIVFTASGEAGGRAQTLPEGAGAGAPDGAARGPLGLQGSDLLRAAAAALLALVALAGMAAQRRSRLRAKRAGQL